MRLEGSIIDLLLLSINSSTLYKFWILKLTSYVSLVKGGISLNGLPVTDSFGSLDYFPYDFPNN